MAANFEHPLADGPLGDRGWSASRKFASLMAAGDPFFIDSCNKERLAMDASLIHDTFEGQFAPAVAAQTCLFTAMDKVLSSPCRNLFVAASKCIHEQGLQRAECQAVQSALYACTRKHKLAAQHVTINRAAKLGEHESLQDEWEMSKRVFGNGPSAEAPSESGPAKH